MIEVVSWMKIWINVILNLLYLRARRFLPICYGVPHIHTVNLILYFSDVTSSQMIEGW